MKKWISVLVLISLGLLSGCWKVKSGEKSGVIVKVAKEGKYWGTYEGEIIRGGLEDASGVTGRSFHFTLGQFKSSLVEQALVAMQNNSHVIISYHCDLIVLPWRGETKCFIDKIKEIESKNVLNPLKTNKALP
ncbi:MAG: hypothetical protein H0U70_01455 [Tatlockia sp.]|nr:hypothetical protein [Tatlockia sp.]